MKKHDKLCRWVISNVYGLTDLVQITLYFSTWIVTILLAFRGEIREFVSVLEVDHFIEHIQKKRNSIN